MTFAAFAAAILFSGHFEVNILFPLAGIFLLASGASSLNQVMEKDRDAMMERTCNRPVACGEITVNAASIISAILIIAGLAFIAGTGGRACLLLGVFNLLWYNLFYTWLKTKSAFAVVPGALTGAVPVLMGWTAAGGHPFDFEVLLLAFFMFLWQVPHFWLLTLMCGEEYKKAGFPVLADHFRKGQMNNIIYSWLVAASFASVLLWHFHVITDIRSGILIILANLALMIIAARYLFYSGKDRTRLLFSLVNIFMFSVLAILVLEKLLI